MPDADEPALIVLTLRPLRSDRSWATRLRQLLKHALRQQQFRNEGIVYTDRTNADTIQQPGTPSESEA